MVVPSHLQSDGGAIPKIIMKNTGRWLVVIVVVALSGGMVWQWRALRMAQAENAALNAAAAEGDLLKEEVEQLRKNVPDAGELEKTRQAQSELLRLRGEVSQLREQLKEEREARAAAGRAPMPVAAPQVTDDASPMVLSYKSELSTTLGPKQALLTGGWRMQDGNRGLVLVQPTVSGESNGQDKVSLQTYFVALPEEVLSSFGLEAISVEGAESSTQAIMDTDQFQSLVSNLKETKGVTFMTAPKISTLDGHQAALKIGGVRTIDGETFEVGPSIDILPHIIRPKGNGLNMTVVARIREQKTDAK